jgi:hypothetical protein
MDMWWKVTLLVLIVIVVSITAAIFFGAKRWDANTRDLHAKMEAGRRPVDPAFIDLSELDGLPAPVQRYIRAVLRDGQPLLSAVSMEHTGTFNMSETEEQWKPFTSMQRVILQRPGFVWDARIRMAPGVSVHVHDAYVAGEGILKAKLSGLLTVMEQPPSAELAHGELMRFLAEAAWYPTALLPSQGVLWRAIDEHRATATLTDGSTTVELLFHFDSRGLISSVYSEGRYREADGVMIAMPWEGVFWDYEMRHGMLIPLQGEVRWLMPDGPAAYWRGRIERIHYDNQVQTLHDAETLPDQARIYQ